MRQSGVLLHITSLPSRGGIGTLGQAAYDFVDFVKASGMTIWQMLPIGPTGYAESPYQSASTFAGNPLMIDFDLLIERGILPNDSYEPLDIEAYYFVYDTERNYYYAKTYSEHKKNIKKLQDEGIFDIW